MSDYFRVMCRADAGISSRDLAQFIIDGSYFDDKPTFEPTGIMGRDDSGRDWLFLTIHYDSGRRPIIVWKSTDNRLVQEEIAEASDALTGAGFAAEATLYESLKSTTVIYALEVNTANLDDDAWSMIDSVEAYLARQGDGIVYVPGDGFFDADLRRLVAL